MYKIMADNEMLKNAVKALEKKYSGNGFVAVDNEGRSILRGERFSYSC